MKIYNKRYNALLKLEPHEASRGMVIENHPPFSFGGAEEDRTPDLLNAIQALSQLSYNPIEFL